MSPESGGGIKPSPVPLLSSTSFRSAPSAPPMKQHITLVGTIGDGFTEIFRTQPGQVCILHSNTFWESFYILLVFELGSNLLNPYEQGREADVRQDLLLLLLQRAANCVSMMLVKGLKEILPVTGAGVAMHAVPGGDDGVLTMQRSSTIQHSPSKCIQRQGLGRREGSWLVTSLYQDEWTRNFCISSLLRQRSL